MIKQDYLLRMILSAEQLPGMEAQDLTDRYEGDPDPMGKIELAAFK